MTDAHSALSAAAFLIQAAQADPQGVAQATVAICQVLSNIFYLLFAVVLGFGILAYVPILAAAAILFHFVKGGEKSHETLRSILKVLVFGMPPLIMLLLAAVYAIMVVFAGGQCGSLI
jgi:hypothetical protein